MERGSSSKPNMDLLRPKWIGLTLDFDAGGGFNAAQMIVCLATIRARCQLAGLEQNETAVRLQLQCGRGLGQLATVDEPLYVWLWPAAGGAI
ncbi:GH23492 [Drosophila grimshawi]|uniref:GH23492 n=1 Tax=Drosophila grimshawi TaxID=7222 RepID=B4K423_DROGR|nr:GH23492 [Drosophila grimshawi]